MTSESAPRTGKRRFVSFFVTIAACTPLVSVEGPTPPAVPTISSVVVTSLESAGQESRVLNHPVRVKRILSSYAFSPRGWSRTGSRRLLPIYRLDLHTDTGVAAVYWLGTNSYPPRFPCYALCSGWWLAASSLSGDLEPTRYKPLPDSVYLPLTRDLEIP